MGRLPPYVHKVSPFVFLIGVGVFAVRSACVRRADEANRPPVLPSAQVAVTQPIDPAALVPVAAPAISSTCIPQGLSPQVTFLQCAPPVDAIAPEPHRPRGDCRACHRIKPAPPLGQAAVIVPTNLTVRQAEAFPRAPSPQFSPAPAQPTMVSPPRAPPPQPPVAAAPPMGREAMEVPPPSADPTPAAADGARPWDWTEAITGGQPGGTTLPFMEGHWQGLEVLPLWPTLAAALNISPDVQGVLVDEITQPADGQGFAAGDVVTAIDGIPTPTVEAFLAATDQVRDAPSAQLALVRDGQPITVVLTALQRGDVLRLGTANGETAPMIAPGMPRPHAYIGPCTNCHRIGLNGSIPVDPGTLFPLTAPPIKAGTPNPHKDRGPCRACHTIQ